MIGQTLHNRYTLTAPIGKGAMGTVYRATDSQTGDEVAVKVIAGDLAFDEEMLERFRREGEALRQLRHPNIVGLVDTFQHDPDPSGGAGGQQVIVMEYVAGGSLHSLIKQGPLPVDRARKIALGLCDALTRAHDLEIIHRDIKPENILVADDGTPKLTDFGIARLLTEGTRITHSGVQVGTPYYMSPEAWEGKPLDAQADIWSLGIVLFEMLAGEVPFPGDTVIAVMHKVLTAPLPELKQLRPDALEGLAQIVRRMMTRDKVGRYQTMREVGLDLERGMPTVVPAPPARRRAWPWLVAGAAIIILALGAWLAVAGRQFADGAAQPMDASAVATPLATLVRPTGPSASAPSLATAAPQSTVSAVATQAKVAYSQNGDIYVANVGGTDRRRLTNDPMSEDHPAWSPDGQKIAFDRCQARLCSNAHVLVMNADGTGQVNLTSDKVGGAAPSWSPDGRFLSFNCGSDLCVMRSDGTELRKLVDFDDWGNYYSAWSPDGARIAYTHTVPGGDSPGPYRWFLLVVNADGMNRISVHSSSDVSEFGWYRPWWSPDSKQIAFTELAGTTYVVDADGIDNPKVVDESIVETWSQAYWPWPTALDK